MACVADELVGLLGGLFEDIELCAPYGVAWTVSARHLPADVEVMPADGTTASFSLHDGAMAEVVAGFATQLQEWLIPQLGASVPRCPYDGATLEPRLVGSTPDWRCPQGDFECEFGAYLTSLWPPAADDPEAARMLARRLHDAGVRVRSVGFIRRGGSSVAHVTLYEGDTEASARAAAEPFEVEFDWAEPPWTERFTESTSDGTFRGLRLRGGRPGRLARLTGALARPPEGEDADIRVGDTSVRLGPDHRIGSPGEPLLLAADGDPVAEVGDLAVCTGGFTPSCVRGERSPFHAWEIRVRVG